MTARELRLLMAGLALGYVAGYIASRIQSEQELHADLTALWRRSGGAPTK